MATRLYRSWLSTISDFLILVWKDESFTDETAKKLTHFVNDNYSLTCRQLEFNITFRGF